MQLVELKKNMSVLDQVLAKTSTNIEINVTASNTARERILKKYRQSCTNCLIITAVFICLLIGNVSATELPNMYKAYIAIMCAMASVWYIFLFFRLKNINISELVPRELFAATTKIKMLTLSGEIFFGIALAVFFTLLLSDMLEKSPIVFVLIVATLAFGLIRSAVYFWPRYIKLFRDLSSIK